ncbi:fimbrial assembly protein [Brenneria roseae subsp. americana]|uniref:Fimbrial assembly protein n=1 Tax=Brenneria roseae subsp. americana TaxID=1508507 RepID=A0A2U1TL80_9GAMM|nr:fimbria/pilus outer membrane usher protein [Brenneria roseae]PWC10167.1 fimbrial assembly protein [Brenneria roseae subsp. americana]
MIKLVLYTRKYADTASLILWSAIITLFFHSALLAAEEFTDLPAPPRGKPAINEAIYYLTITVNGQSDNNVVPVTYRSGSYYVDAVVLRQNRVKVPAQPSGLINVNALPEVTVEYDPSQQQLKLNVPPDWLPAQEVAGVGTGTQRLPPRSSPGLLLNYNAYYAAPSGSTDTLNTLLEQRFFSDYGMVTNTGIYNFSTGNRGASQRQGYRRFDTYWRYSDSERMLTYQVGDLISDSLTWSNSVRMGGVRFSRNFAIRPDIVTYPLIQYSGSAAVPSTLDLFINGYKAGSSTLNPGPFTLTNTPYLNGAGEATVITTDAQGRQISTTVPFYVSNTLLRAGLSDFDLSVGVLRRDYGFRNEAYASDPVVSGIYRYGLTNWLTLSTHTEAVNDLFLLGAGADFTVGRWGTVSSSYSQSEKAAVGHQYTLGYSYYTQPFGLNLQHAKRDAAYRDLTTLYNSRLLSRQSNQATLSSQLFGKGNGTAGIGYFDIQAFDGSRTQLLNVSYTRQLWQGSSVYLALNKTLGDNDYSAQLQFVIPFGSNDTINASLQRNTRNDYSPRLGITRSTPTDGGFGWNAAYAAGREPYYQGALSWRGPYNLLQGGVYGNEGNTTRWGELSGALIYMNGSLFPSNRINDAFLVVDTEGYEGVPVKYENQLVGVTDRRGHLLVPWVTSNYPAKIEIDSLALPANVDTPQIEDRVSVREGSGIVVTFPLHQVLAANIALRDTTGQPPAIGTTVTDTFSGNTTFSGHEGLTYFSHLRTFNRLRFQQADGQICQVEFSLPETQTIMATIGPLACQVEPKG